jgi:hypothetical protein
VIAPFAHFINSLLPPFLDLRLGVDFLSAAFGLDLGVLLKSGLYVL